MNKQYFFIFLLCIIIPSVIFFSYKIFFSSPTQPPALNHSLENYLQPLRKGIVTSVITNFESKNTITAIDTTGKNRSEDEPNYVIKIQIAELDGTVSIYIMKDQLKTTTILIPDGPGYKKGSFTDLRPGDTILLTQVTSYNMKGQVRYPTILKRQITKINR